MEVTLIRRIYIRTNILKKCFNPCFNGSYSYTIHSLLQLPYNTHVSILVLMEVTLIPVPWLYLSVLLEFCFNPCFNGSYSYTSIDRSRLLIDSFVSILVLMEVTLIHFSIISSNLVLVCFNPCFNGSYSYTLGGFVHMLCVRKFQSLF